jgi:hypothetical protein
MNDSLKKAAFVFGVGYLIFWLFYNQLPEDIEQIADAFYELLKTNPNHPSLYFKRVNKYWSVRVGKDYRALGIEVKNGILWFWINPLRTTWY